MPLIALACVKASPGVTTTSLALAAAWPAPRRMLIEADPAGGDLASWLGLPSAPGLAGLAAASRREAGPETAWRHARELPGGLAIVPAPPGAEQAAACLAALTAGPASLLAALAEGPEPVIIDCGRLDPGSPALAITARAQVTLLLARPRVSELSHLALRADALASAGASLALVLAPDAGRGPAEPSYPAAEIAATLEIPVLATIPADPRSAASPAALAEPTPAPGQRRVRRRPPLARATASLAAQLAAGRGAPPAQPAPADPLPQATAGPEAGSPLPRAEVTAGDPAR